MILEREIWWFLLQTDFLLSGTLFTAVFILSPVLCLVGVSFARESSHGLLSFCEPLGCLKSFHNLYLQSHAAFFILRWVSISTFLYNHLGPLFQSPSYTDGVAVYKAIYLKRSSARSHHSACIKCYTQDTLPYRKSLRRNPAIVVLFVLVFVCMLKKMRDSGRKI